MVARSCRPSGTLPGFYQITKTYHLQGGGQLHFLRKPTGCRAFGGAGNAGLPAKSVTGNRLYWGNITLTRADPVA